MDSTSINWPLIEWLFYWHHVGGDGDSDGTAAVAQSVKFVIFTEIFLGSRYVVPTDRMVLAKATN